MIDLGDTKSPQEDETVEAQEAIFADFMMDHSDWMNWYKNMDIVIDIHMIHKIDIYII